MSVFGGQPAQPAAVVTPAPATQGGAPAGVRTFGAQTPPGQSVAGYGLDQVFTGLDGTILADDLHGDDLAAWRL
jgi:hypothetical protein